MNVDFLDPPGLCPTFGWTHVVSVRNAAKTVYVSGQVAVDAKGSVVGKGDLKRQTEQAFENVTIALTAAGAKWSDVVKTGIFVVGLKPTDVPILREVRSRYIDQKRPPASTLVGVAALVGADWLIEMEVVAELTN
ncbi:MAG TPA: RidA family protein [Gemmataceae bacterium]|jgi:enamine deaminase RidA (YjgF/YER057c/UK114 family)|nr:RidA family protein [Gemmataceae bacterium]